MKTNQTGVNMIKILYAYVRKYHNETHSYVKFTYAYINTFLISPFIENMFFSH